MWLRSCGFDNGGAIPSRYTCDGENMSPSLTWGDVPVGARSLAIVLVDPDAPHGAFYHWAVYDIMATTSGLAEAASASASLAQGVNDFRKVGYGGPCPPHGDRPHHYRLRLLALSRDKLELSPRPSCRMVERTARGSLLEEATVVGLYFR